MPQLKQNTFTSYEFSSPEEEFSAFTFTSLNVCAIQNLIAERATLRQNLKLDPNNVIVFAQEESYIHGQIDVLQYLLDNHNNLLENKTAEIAFASSLN